MKILSSITFLFFLIVISCSPVKTRYNVPKETLASTSPLKESTGTQSLVKPKKFEYRSRFRDTSDILLENVTAEKIKPDNNEIPYDNNSRFSKALEEYDNDHLNLACSEFEYLAKIIQPADNDFYELQFYRIECLIVNEKLKEAETYLLDWLSFDKLPDLTRQKMLVRLGQVYCLVKEYDEANKVFDKFLKDYPNSELHPFANCEILNK